MKNFFLFQDILTNPIKYIYYASYIWNNAYQDSTAILYGKTRMKNEFLYGKIFCFPSYLHQLHIFSKQCRQGRRYSPFRFPNIDKNRFCDMVVKYNSRIISARCTKPGRDIPKVENIYIFKGRTLNFGIYTLLYATFKPWSFHKDQSSIWTTELFKNRFPIIWDWGKTKHRCAANVCDANCEWECLCVCIYKRKLECL